MRFDDPQLLARRDVPPDEPAVIAAGDGGLAGQCQAGDVALMLAEGLRLRLGLRQIQFVHLEVGAAEENTVTIRYSHKREGDAASEDVLEDFHGRFLRGSHKWLNS